jgi:microcystin-dependent protein
MSDPYVGEIRMFGGNFAPAGWAFCNGALMPIAENDALFQLIGTTYGGDGVSTFGIPDLQGRVPVHQGQGPGVSQVYTIGEKAGVETVTLTTNQIPVHTHSVVASQDLSNTTSPANNVLAQNTQILMYTQDTVSKFMPPNTVSAVGGNQPHDNMQQYLAISFIISLFGIFPHQ